MAKTKVTWKPIAKYDLEEALFETYDNSVSCCGVLELEGLVFDKVELEVHSRETKTTDDKDFYGHTYPVREPLKTRKATFREISRGFKAFIKEQKSDYGLTVCYLLPDQHRGDFGRLLKADRWEYLGQFWNPKTRNTLHHWVKTLHGRAPRRKKSSKSSLGRR